VRGLYPKHGGTEASESAHPQLLDVRRFALYLAIMLINEYVK